MGRNKAYCNIPNAGKFLRKAVAGLNSEREPGVPFCARCQKEEEKK